MKLICSSRSLATAAALAGLASFAVAQAPALLRDVNAGPPPEPSSWPTEFVAFQGQVYFGATAPETGHEVYRSDGTTAGTTLFHESIAGEEGGGFGSATQVGAQLFFGAEDTAHGSELWVTDGTQAGTRLCRDIRPGPDDSGPYQMAAFGGRLFFRAMVDGIGIELWSSDGTEAGTRLFADLNRGPSSSMPKDLTVVGGRLFFVASDGVHGAEPWVTDGTAAGTRLLVDAYPGSTESGAEPLGLVGGRLVFRTYNGPDPLWITDGTPAGTQPIPTALTGVRYTRAVLGNVLLFAGYDPVFGEELWRTDGTAQGTSRVVDIRPGLASSQPWLLGVANGRALFATEPHAVDELWATDGTAAGTMRIAQLNVWPNSGIELGGALLFRASDAAHGEELWRSDGTAAGTWMVKDAWPGTAGSVPGIWIRFGSQVVYAARDPLGGEPWITDGTDAGTRMLANVGANPPSWTGDSNPGDSVDWNGQLAFAATTGRTDPWVSDGSAAGTRLYQSFPGSDPFIMLNENGNPRLHVARGELVSVVGNVPNADLWLDGGSGPILSSPIVLGQSSRPLSWSAAAGGFLWLVGDDLWRVDRGVATRMPIATGQPSYASELTPVGQDLLCVAHQGAAGYGLFRCDANGSALVVPLPGSGGSYMTAVEDRAYLVIDDPVTGTELWVTDGTAAGTRALDLAPGAASSRPMPLCAYDGALLFLADDGQHGTEIWATRGTVASTVRLTDLPGQVDPYTFRLLRIGLDRFVFAHDDGVHGPEPWLLTPAGAALAVDAVPGPDGSFREWLGAVGEEAYFRGAADALWRTDGTAAGTRLLMLGLDTDGWLDSAAGQVFLDHDDGVLGHEPWTFSAGATAKIVGEACGVGMRAPWLESSDPVLGRTWTVRGGGGPVASVGLLVIGRPAVVPFLLAGGCTSYVDPGSIAVLHVVANAASRWGYQLPLPSVPALIGVQLAAQCWVGPSANPSGLESSPAIWLSLDTR